MKQAADFRAKFGRSDHHPALAVKTKSRDECVNSSKTKLASTGKKKNNH